MRKTPAHQSTVPEVSHDDLPHHRIRRTPRKPAPDPGDIDGRSLRATGRTHQFSTRIKLATHKQMKRIAVRDGITLGELIERALEAYEAQAAEGKAAR